MSAEGNAPLQGSEEAAAEAYDALPYPSRPYPFSHPDRLAGIGRLHGLKPADIRTARILEIGCSDGGNLLAIAAGLPDCHCVGIDVSPRQISMAVNAATALGLKHVEFREVGILGFSDPQPFDFIIAHGVFSWVPDVVRDGLLACVRTHLAPHGLAYISYNVYPGWHENMVMRDMMRFHTRGLDDPREMVAAATECVGVVADMAEGVEAEHLRRLRSFHARLTSQTERPAYLYHEYLEAENVPMYFQQFVAKASSAGLVHVEEADHASFEPGNLSPELADQVRAWSRDELEEQQYVDFIRGTRFRRSILCRDDAKPLPASDPAALPAMRFASPYKPTSKEPDEAGAPREFAMDNGRTLTASHPVSISILEKLASIWPGDCSYQGLVTAAGDTDADVPKIVFSLYRSGALHCRTVAAPCVAEISDHPRASQLARWQARRGTCVMSQLHVPVDLDDPAARFLLPLLDGTRSIEDIAARMAEAVADGVLSIQYQGKPLAERADLSTVLPEFVRFHLRKMVQLALIVR